MIIQCLPTTRASEYVFRPLFSVAIYLRSAELNGDFSIFVGEITSASLSSYYSTLHEPYCSSPSTRILQPKQFIRCNKYVEWTLEVALLLI